MKDDIRSKLATELEQPISSERQVVYILVELRKLLELDERLDGFPTLSLCCDWAVHPRLNRRSAQRIVKYFDDYEREYRRQNIGVEQYGLAEMLDFVEHRTFRSQLIDACAELPTGLFSDDRLWRSFLLHYLGVVKDCPLEAKGDGTAYVTRVYAQAVSPATAAVIMPGKWGVQWTWYRKDIEAPNLVMSFF